MTAAIAKGVETAKKNLIKVPVHKGTIPHEQSAKFGGSRIFLKPASEGTGVKGTYGAMRAVLESVGITDVLAKSKGSSNPHNLVNCTIAALGGSEARHRWLRTVVWQWIKCLTAKNNRNVTDSNQAG